MFSLGQKGMVSGPQLAPPPAAGSSIPIPATGLKMDRSPARLQLRAELSDLPMLAHNPRKRNRTNRRKLQGDRFWHHINYCNNNNEYILDVCFV